MRKVGWAVMAILAVSVGAYALTIVSVSSARPEFVATLIAEKPLRAMAHLAAGGIALAAGAFQFSTRLRTRRAGVHRALGRVYVGAVVVSGVAGGLLAIRSSGGVTAHFGFGLLAVLWVGTAVAALVRARAGDFASHRRWMLRSYALCLAAVTLRVYLPLAFAAGVPFDLAYPAISWMCWVPNLVVVEWWLLDSSVAPLEV